jgi:SH3 domain protein
MNRVAFLALLAGLTIATAQAETVYVDDTLRVGVRNNPGNTETPIEVITSGASLEVLERTKGYLRVRTGSGAEGWVSSVYVTSEPPARTLLEQAKKDNARLQDELRVLRGNDVSKDGQRVTGELENLRKQNAELQARVDASAGQAAEGVQSSWILRSAIMIGLLLLGFVLGKRHERERVASRFNGLQL